MSRGGNINEESLPGVRVEQAPSFQAEMEAFDAMGPLARAALLDFPVKMLAWQMYRQCLANCWNMKDPPVDRHVEWCIRTKAATMPRIVPDEFQRDDLGAPKLAADRVRRIADRAERRAAA